MDLTTLADIYDRPCNQLSSLELVLFTNSQLMLTSDNQDMHYCYELF